MGHISRLGSAGATAATSPPGVPKLVITRCNVTAQAVQAAQAASNFLVNDMRAWIACNFLVNDMRAWIARMGENFNAL